MDDTAKYVIHADITADGVVERSDVVGAVFGQTEGLLGDDLDLRDLQQSSKLGRIDVDVDSENGQSFGTITIASSLDKVETSILAAALETISRVGPCRATVSIAGIEDVRAAKRRKVVDRAKELLSDSFDEDVMTSREILEEVRQSVRVEDIVEYEGLPAGPRAEDSDAIVVVEGRSDVLNLLKYGVKNAVAVEGTNVPDVVADLTQNRTVTVFLDDDRGGDLIRKELAQVGDIDYVAFAPAGKSVEDLARHEVMSALRSKRPFEESMVADEEDDEGDATDGAGTETGAGTAEQPPADAGGSEAGPAATDGSARPAPESETGSDRTAAPDAPETPHPDPRAESTESDGIDDEGLLDDSQTREAESLAEESVVGSELKSAVESDAEVEADTEAQTDTEADAKVESAAKAETAEPVAEAAESDAEAEVAEADVEAGETEPVAEAAAETEPESAADTDAEVEPKPATLREHVEEVVDSETGTARLISESFETLGEVAAENAFDAVEEADEIPYAVVVDGLADQRLLDVSAQRGVGQIVAAEVGESVKRPADVRIRTADQF